jgi:hypothetical protein
VQAIWAFLADLIVMLHLAYVLFAVGGELLVLAGGVLKWPALRIAHLAAVVVVALEALVGLLCPFTSWEYALRLKAGQRVEQQIPFVARLVRRVIFYDFPDWVFTLTYVLFAGLVVLTLALFPPRRTRKAVAPRRPEQ